MDVSTFPDLDMSGRSIDEDASIIECFRRGLTQPAGTLEYSPSDGFYLRTLLSRGIDTRLTYAYEAALETQATRDERVAKAKATVTYDTGLEKLSAVVVLVKADGSKIRLTVAADSLSLTLLRES